MLIQLLDTGSGPKRPKWLEEDTHNYAHLLQATVPRHPALLAVKASLSELCAYSATFAPHDALEELTAYLLSWAASAAPFQPLTAHELQQAAASDKGAHRVAELLLKRALPADTARVALLEGFCSSLTRRARHTSGARLVGHVFSRLLSTMPLRLLVIMLGRLLPLLQSTAVPGVPLVQASGKSASGRPTAASLMHTMACLPADSSIACHARSADVCGLRQFYVLFQPAISNLGHFHPQRPPPANSKPDGNTRFAPGTLLLFEGTLNFPHLELDGPIPPIRQHEGVTIAAERSCHGFTYATELIPLPVGPWPVTHREAVEPALRVIDTTLPGSHALLDQGGWTPDPDVADHRTSTVGLLPFIVHEAHCQQAKQKDRRLWKEAHDANQAAPWGLTGYFLDPELFRMLAQSSRLQLPSQPLHTPRWRQTGCLFFRMHLHHVRRVGHLQPLTAWRSLLYPSPARLPMTWGVTDLPLPMPHDLPSPDLTATARWLVRALIGAEPAHASPSLPLPG